MAIKDILPTIRQERGLTQQELAERLYVTRQAVSRWETGETTPSIDMTKLLAITLEVPVGVLLEMPEHFCQSCGMPIIEPSAQGTEADGSLSDDYCKMCYQDGAYTYEADLDNMIEGCGHWADLRESTGKVAPGTVKRARDKLDSIAHLIGDMRLVDVTPAVLENAYLDLRSGKSKSGKRLSGTYVSDIHKKVSLMMDHAKKNGYIKENPCKQADAPKNDTPEKRAMSAAQIANLIDALKPTEPMECGVLLCATLGLRRGEAVGLSWGDVDFAERTVHVQHSYDDAGNLNTPKTKSGNRVLPMPDVVYDALLKRHAIQLAFFSSYARDLLDIDDEGNVVGFAASAPIVSDPWVNRIHPSGLGHWWYKHRASFGLGGWRLHDLRHSFLTVAAQQGVHPSVMQKLAGHSTSRLTMDVYTHANLEDKRQAMESTQQAFTKHEDGDSSESTEAA